MTGVSFSYTINLMFLEAASEIICVSCTNGYVTKNIDDWRILACDPGINLPTIDDDDEWGLSMCSPELEISEFEIIQTAAAYSISPGFFEIPVFRVGNLDEFDINYIVGTEFSTKSTPYGLVEGIITGKCKGE